MICTSPRNKSFPTVPTSTIASAKLSKDAPTVAPIKCRIVNGAACGCAYTGNGAVSDTWTLVGATGTVCVAGMRSPMSRSSSMISNAEIGRVDTSARQRWISASTRGAPLSGIFSPLRCAAATVAAVSPSNGNVP